MRRLATFLALLPGAALAALALLLPAGPEPFRIPVAFTFHGDSLWVLEKQDNTLLRLVNLPGEELELAGSREISPDDPAFYYMVRQLFPSAEGTVAQSYVYSQGEAKFLGYRFDLYRSFEAKPETILTVLLPDPEEAPEIKYASGADGAHYFANNCRGRRAVWKLTREARGLVMKDGALPPGMQELGEENAEFSFWMSIYADREGTIYLASGSADRLVVLDSAGNPAGTIGEPGLGFGELLAPADIFSAALDGDQAPRLTVANTGERNWVQFDPAGRAVRVTDPIAGGYPHPDILVGRIYRSGGENLTYDLANKCLVRVDRGFEAVSLYRAPKLTRTFLLLGGAGLLALGLLARKRVARLVERRRFPVFLKLLFIFAPLVAAGLLVSARVRRISRDAYLEETRLRFANLAHAVRNSVPLEDLKSIDSAQDRGSEAYERIFAAASSVVDRKDVPQTPKWIIHKILDGRYYFGINAWRGPIFEPFIVPAERRIFIEALRKKQPHWGRFIDDQGEWFSYVLPVVGAGGEVINVIELYRSTEEMKRVDRETLRRITENALGIVVAFAGLALAFSWFFVRRLKRLTAGTEAISRGDFERRVKIDSRDEVGDLGRAFNRMAEDLKTYTGELERNAAEKERIQSDLRLARQIQQDILPQVFPPEVGTDRAELYGTMLPAREVGGDFYDYLMLEGNRIGAAIADVSGKGIPASLFMMATRTLLRSHAASDLDPAAALAKTNRMLCLNNTSCTFVTLFYFVCDLQTGRIRFANAGHNPPVVLRGREAGFVPAPAGRHGTALGILEEAVYLPQELSLAPGESLILYTDGLTEAINAAQELFGEERLLEAASAAAGLPPRAVAETIFSRLREFVGEAEQFDDITLLVFRRLPAAPGPRPELGL